MAAFFLAVRCLRATKVAGGALQSAKWVKRRTSQLFNLIAKTFNKLNNDATKLINAEVELGQRRRTCGHSRLMAPCPFIARLSWGFEIPQTESALVRVLNAIDVVIVKE